ncbi:hypothetical protein ACUN7V_20795 [Quadrisphaera oryzae]|uniref:hypothetical protein n=1 Tax=Quadrisphaera TaxID=317661 RepID=UPI0016460DC4|nr:hypothetical protein [Quadrisphaera sp. RL12-1S]MBC3760962.1 hypothetical protein [Quadrisphaera sp. RL12-1S]
MGRPDQLGTRTRVAGTAALVVVLSGCGQAGVGEAGAVQAPGPIPVVEPTCMADYPWYGSAADVVSRADVVVRVAATGPSRDYQDHPLPQAGMSPQEFARFREETVLDATAITVEALEVLKGDVTVGERFEVAQNTCTARPLPVGDGREYLLALERFDPGHPMNQLNDSQAAWQVLADRTLVPVNPENDLGVTSVDQLAALVGHAGAGALVGKGTA